MAVMNKLSAKAVEAIHKQKKDGKHADGGGLFLHVTDAGGFYWRYKYRLAGRERLYAIGTYPEVSLIEARDKHGEARKLVAKGLDPVGERRRDKAEKEAARAALRPFREIAQEWYDDMIKPHAAKKTCSRAERAIAALNADFGGKAITTIEMRDLTGVLLKYERAKKYETRQRTQQIAVAIMGFAVGRGYGIKHNPFLGVKFASSYTSPSVNYESRPALTEPHDFGRLLRDIEHAPDLVRRALRILALVFVRPGELMQLRWSNIKLKEAKMVVPFEFQKMRTLRKKRKSARNGQDFEVPLSRQVTAELKALHKLTGHTPYLFPSQSSANKASHMHEKNLIDALNSLDYQGKHCPHGFRSSASTMLNAERVTVGDHETLRWPDQKALIEVQLDHDDASTQAIYDRGGRWKERSELMQLWADRIDEMRDKRTHLRVVA